MNWGDIQLFEAASSSGSLTAGAKALGISQPQMSRRLRALEQSVGARLFDRTPQGLRPTAAGAKLIPLAAEMRDAADAVLRIKPDLKSAAMTVVRISVDEIRERFLTLHLPELISALPDIEIEIVSEQRHPDHEWRMTDIQIRSCLSDSETLVARRIGTTAFRLYTSTTLFDSRIRGLSAEALREQGWIGVPPDHLWHPLLKNWLDGFFLHPSTLRLNTMTGMLNAARAGAGLAMLPDFMAQEYDDLVHVPCEDALIETAEYIIVHRDLLREPAIRRAVDAIVSLK